MEVRELKRTEFCGGKFGGISLIGSQNSSNITTRYFSNLCLLDRTTLQIVPVRERPANQECVPVLANNPLVTGHSDSLTSGGNWW
jgi:hypothetical protein